MPMLSYTLSTSCWCVQVKELNTECIRLTTTSLGTNATVIGNSMEEVQLAWESLQVASSARKKKLRAALELQKLLSYVSVWCVHAIMNNIEYVHIYVHVSYMYTVGCTTMVAVIYSINEYMYICETCTGIYMYTCTKHVCSTSQLRNCQSAH